jgi:serine/threonine-protein kinase
LLSQPDEFFWLQANPAYIAPELVRGERPTPLSDVYGLGALVYAALVGVGPFDAIAPRNVVRAKAFQVPPPLRQLRPNLPLALSDVVAKAMDRVPERRYPSAGAFALALTQAAAPQRAASLVRSLALAAALLLAAVAGERFIQQTPPLITQPRAAALESVPPVVVENPSVEQPQPVVTPARGMSERQAVEAELERPPIRGPFAAPVAEAAEIHAPDTAAGRSSLAAYQPETIDVTLGAPLTITISEPEPTATTRPVSGPRQASPLLTAPMYQAPLPATNYRAPSYPAVKRAPVVRSAPVVRPAPAPKPAPNPQPAPSAKPSGWTAPVSGASSWKRP